MRGAGGGRPLADDSNANGTLEREEFTAMIAGRLVRPPTLEFSVFTWCPVSLCGLDLLPWGTRSVKFKAHAISVIGSDGPCNLQLLSCAAFSLPALSARSRLGLLTGTHRLCHTWSLCPTIEGNARTSGMPPTFRSRRSGPSICRSSKAGCTSPRFACT
jgi:hypothetical protein